MTLSVPNSGETFPVPKLHLGLGVTGHRDTHPVFHANRSRIAATVETLFKLIDAHVAEIAVRAAPCEMGRTRLHSLLAYGADLVAFEKARALGWDSVSPLPFGLALNTAINAQAHSVADMEAILAGEMANDPDVAARQMMIRQAASQSRLFELADQDAAVAGLFATQLASGGDVAAAQAFQVAASDRAAMAGRVMIEQSDLIIGIWDGKTRGATGGTRHTIATALELGVPILWIDASTPEDWQIIHVPEALTSLTKPSEVERLAQLKAVVSAVLLPMGDNARDDAALEGLTALQSERWSARSNPVFHAYRRVESLFGDAKGWTWPRLRQIYETPEAIIAGSAAKLLTAARALPGGDRKIVTAIENDIFKPFAFADGVSAYLSDAYRGGMVTNFILSALAVMCGIAYLPFASIEDKWAFALVEFLLLSAIIAITMTGGRRRWHGRWFETRRVAEYFRHAPILLLFGVARSTGRWPRGSDRSWPEWYARQVLRGIGLPHMIVTPAYLRSALDLLQQRHIRPQRDYHRAKAARLTRAEHALDKTSQRLFILAVISVAIYLIIEVGATAHILSATIAHDVAKSFTFLGVMFPTIGGALAGIRYFGDFERFAAISEITAEKLDAIDGRATLLLRGDVAALTFAQASIIAHAIDEIVVTEIENWQSVFGGKHITVPV
jgi:hypothetical protein